MFLDRYFAGTISVSANGTAVTGVGTAWVANGVQAGDYLHARGLMIRIGAVVSNTSITLAEGWPGSALSGASYAILYRVDADRYGAGQAQLLSTLASGNLSSLAGLAGTAGRVPYFAGTNTMAETPLTAWGRSLIDDADAAGFWSTVGATSGAAQAYRRGNVIDTVSQVAGVPSGGLLERGNTGDGGFVRFADGTQFCDTSLALVTTGETTWTFPRPFAIAPRVIATLSGGTVGFARIVGNTTTTCDVSGYGSAWTRISGFATAFAVGRWF